MAREISSSIRDNQGRGKIGDFLKDKIQNGSKLSIVTAYFTIYAYEQLKEELQSNLCPHHGGDCDSGESFM